MKPWTLIIFCVILSFGKFSAVIICDYETSEAFAVECFDVGAQENELNFEAFIQFTNEEVEEAKSAHLKNCKISSLANEAFERLSKIKKLDLSNNLLVSLNANSFSGVVGLNRLNLSGNRLNTVDLETLEPLVDLEELDLSHNSIRLTELNFFSALKQLRVLDVSGNIYDGAEYWTLSADILKLNSVPQNGESALNNIVLDGVRRLEMANNKMSVSNLNTTDLGRDLQHADLSHNYFTAIPLQLTRNNIELICVNFSYNRLESITEKMFQMNAKLKSVDLSHNEIQMLEKRSFESNRDLIYLDLSYNILKELKNEVFSNLRQLATLLLSHNKLITLPSTIFASNVNLNVLSLEWNSLNATRSNLLNSNKLLSSLTLSNNKLTQMSPIFFKSLENVKFFDVSNNRLTIVDQNILKMKSLKEADLSCNEITNLPADLMQKSFGEGVILRLHGNPLKCSCVNALLGAKRALMVAKRKLTDGRFATCIVADDCDDSPVVSGVLEEWRRRSAKRNGGLCNY